MKIIYSNSSNIWTNNYFSSKNLKSYAIKDNGPLKDNSAKLKVAKLENKDFRYFHSNENLNENTVSTTANSSHKNSLFE